MPYTLNVFSGKLDYYTDESLHIDGGTASSIYTSSQVINGGNA